MNLTSDLDALLTSATKKRKRTEGEESVELRKGNRSVEDIHKRPMEIGVASYPCDQELQKRIYAWRAVVSVALARRLGGLDQILLQAMRKEKMYANKDQQLLHDAYDLAMMEWNQIWMKAWQGFPLYWHRWRKTIASSIEMLIDTERVLICSDPRRAHWKLYRCILMPFPFPTTQKGVSIPVSSFHAEPIYLPAHIIVIWKQLIYWASLPLRIEITMNREMMDRHADIKDIRKFMSGCIDAVFARLWPDIHFVSRILLEWHHQLD
jgi:hypothetical protein